MRQASIGRQSCFLALALALAGCGKGPSPDQTFVDTIADTIEADCLRMSPAVAQAAQHHKQLCTCTGQGIRTSGIKPGDGDKANNDKIHAVQQACRRQILGAES